MVKLVSVGHAATRIVSIKASLLRELLDRNIDKNTPLYAEISLNKPAREIILKVRVGGEMPPVTDSSSVTVEESEEESLVSDDEEEELEENEESF